MSNQSSRNYFLYPVSLPFHINVGLMYETFTQNRPLSEINV